MPQYPPPTAAPQIKVSVGGDISNGATVSATPDTGAERTACGIDVLRQMGVDTANLRDPSVQLKTADRRQISQLGEFDATLKYGDQETTDTIHVLRGTAGLYLSWYVARDLGVVPPDYPQQMSLAALETSQQSATAVHTQAASGEKTVLNGIPASKVKRHHLVEHYSTGFDGKVKIWPGEIFKVNMAPDPVPFNQYASRPVAYPYRDKLEAKLNKWQEEEIITPQTEPTEWCAPIVVTP